MIEMRFKYSDHGITANTKCASCEEKAKDIRKQYDDYAIIDSSYSEKLEGWICFPCRESNDSHPNGTVIIYKPNEGIAEKYVVMDHEDMYFVCKDITEDLEDLRFDLWDSSKSPIQFSYHRTDGWRGHYEPQAEGWKNLHSDCILSYSQDAQELKKFDVDIKQMLWELGYEFAVCFGTTSNVFSCGYDIMIKESEEKDILEQMTLYSKLMQLATKYRDPERFRLTALTGKDEFDEKDKLLLEAQKRLQKGEDFESVKEDILGKAKH